MCQLCCNPAGESGCCCLNLSLGLMVIAAYFGAIGGLDIYQALETDPRAEAQFISGVATASIGGYVFLCVLLGFLKLGLLAYILTMVAFIVTLGDGVWKLVVFIMNWVEWGKGLSDGSITFQTVMVTSTISQLLTILIILAFANLFWSAACVYRHGGNGCEYKSYKELKSKKQAADMA